MSAADLWAMITITPIQTGTARPKLAQVTGKEGASAFQRKRAIFKDTHWSEPVPIYAYLIDHPEGLFLVDTGDTWRNSVPGYLPRWHPFFTKHVQLRVAPQEEIGVWLHDKGIDPAKDIKAVILTHLHHDHTGGLDHFPHNRIIAGRENYEASHTFIKGMLSGCLPQRWPIWFKPELVEMTGEAIGPFAGSFPITGDGRVFLVPTPGHAKGHLSVVVREEQLTYFIAGDASYNEANLRDEKVDGVTYDPTLSLQTLQNIIVFASAEPTIFLPTHDPDVPLRLQQGLIFDREQR